MKLKSLQSSYSRYFGFGITLTLVLLSLVYWREYQKVRSTEMTSWYRDLRADCAIVLTGGAGRVREGIDLLAQNQVRKLIITGVNPKTQLHEIFQLFPFYPSVNETDVILERRSTTTFGNAHQSLSIAEALNCRRTAIVTSRTHMYRALQTFNSVKTENMELIPRPVYGSPNENHWTEVQFETFKTAFYAVWAF